MVAQQVAVAGHQKATVALQVASAVCQVGAAQAVPGHAGAFMVHHMEVVVQVEQAPESPGFVDGDAVRRAGCRAVFVQRTQHGQPQPQVADQQVEPCGDARALLQGPEHGRQQCQVFGPAAAVRPVAAEWLAHDVGPGGHDGQRRAHQQAAQYRALQAPAALLPAGKGGKLGRAEVVAFGVNAGAGEMLVLVVDQVAVPVQVERIPHGQRCQAQQAIDRGRYGGVAVHQFVLQAHVPAGQQHQCRAAPAWPQHRPVVNHRGPAQVHAGGQEPGGPFKAVGGSIAGHGCTCIGWYGQVMLMELGCWMQGIYAKDAYSMPIVPRFTRAHPCRQAGAMAVVRQVERSPSANLIAK